MRDNRGELYRIAWAVLLVLVLATYAGYGGLGVSEFSSLSEDATERGAELLSGEEEVSESETDSDETRTAEPADSEENETSSGLNVTALKMEIHDEVNERRERMDLNRLVYNEDLDSLAQAHSEDMAQRGYFSHTSPDGVSMSQRYDEANIACAGAENIFRTTSTFGDEQAIAEQVVESWMNSEGHRKNLFGDHSLEGLGIAVGAYDGDRNLFVTQNFC